MTAKTLTKNNSITEAQPSNRTYPVGFDLLDEQGQNVLYIDSDRNGRDLKFLVKNQSKETIVFSKQSGKASKDNYHFELIFRPGTLANWDQITLAESSGWSFQPQQHGKGTVSLYFLSTSDREILPNDSLDLTLQKVSADATGGSRGTRVEFKYRNLKYKSDPDTELKDTRVEHLSIINHRGKKEIPLHVGFYGSNAVLNDGISPNELELRITNTGAESLSLAPNGGRAPKFIISFDSGDEETIYWALGTNSQVKAIEVQFRFENDDWQDATRSSESKSPQWEMKIRKGITQLKSGKSIKVKLSNIITGHQSGHTNMYLRYENMPGYWDGEFIRMIDKAPVLCAIFEKKQHEFHFYENPEDTDDMNKWHILTFSNKVIEVKPALLETKNKSANSEKKLEFTTEAFVFEGNKVRLRCSCSEPEIRASATVLVTAIVQLALPL